MAQPPPPHSPPPPTIYRSAAGEAAIRSLYDKTLAALPFEHEERLVQTSFGTAHVVVCGPAAAPPLVVWHGMSTPAPIALGGSGLSDCLVGIKRFRIYVPDLPYQGSRSEDVELDPAKHEQGKWCLEVLRGLGLVPPAGAEGGKGKRGAFPPPPLHLGASYGASVIADLAVVAPEAIRGAALLVPAGLMPGATWPVLFRLVLPSVLYRLLPCPLTAWLALVSMCDEPVPADLEMVLLSWRHVVRYPQMPGGSTGFPAEQLSRLSAPTIIVAAENDIF